MLRMDSYPKSLTVQNAYMELCSGSKNITVVVRNSTTYPQTLRKKTPVVGAVMVTQIPELPVWISLTEVSKEDHGHQMPKLTVKQWQEKLFEELDLSRTGNHGHQSWQRLPSLSWPNTMMSSHWNLVNLAVPTLPNV